MKKNKKKNVYFITGGKTGGHIYPALSVALKLSEDENNNKVFYIGNKKNMEYELVKKYPQLQFLSIDFDGMPRKISLKLFLWGFKLIFSTLKSIFYILKYNPDALLGTGGFITFPTLFAGYVFNKPIMIHDCDTVPGLVSRVVSRFAKKVSLNFEEAKKFLKCKNIKINGNPIRNEFFTENNIKKDFNTDCLNILVMGGSQGAMKINEVSVNVFKKLLNQGYNLKVVVQTGVKNYEKTLELLESKTNPNLILKPYLNEIWNELKNAHLVIARSGSLSLSEICATSTPSILIPYPFAAANHQEKNARELEKANCSICLCERDLTCDVLEKTIVDLINNRQKLVEMSQNTKIFSKPNALNDIVCEFIGLSQN